MIKRNAHRKGFSLLELAVVMGIIGLVAGVGVTMAAGALKAADRVTTQERLNTIKVALDSYLKTYGVLPCPASRADTPSAATFGVAVSSCTGAGVGYEQGNSIAQGMVPVRSLGLPDSYAGDAWGNKISYVVASYLTDNPTRAATELGNIIVRYGTNGTGFNLSLRRQSTTYSAVANNGGLCQLTVAITSGITSVAPATVVHVRSANALTTGITGSYVVSATAAGPARVTLTGCPYVAGYAADSGYLEFYDPLTGNNASYVVISHGADGRGAYPLNGTAVPANKLCNNSVTANTSPAPCTSSANLNCLDIENCETGAGTAPFDINFFDTTFNDGSTDTVYFDDYVVWGSNVLLRAPIDPTLYTRATHTCPTGVCEAWCAACEYNYPWVAPGTTIPPTGALTAAVPPQHIQLCRKVITSNMTDCKAACFWGGMVTAGNAYYRCP